MSGSLRLSCYEVMAAPAYVYVEAATVTSAYVYVEAATVTRAGQTLVRQPCTALALLSKAPRDEE